MNLVLVTPPSAAPLSVGEAKSHVRLASGITVDDGDVGRYIDAAVGLLEGYANRAFVHRTLDLILDDVEGGVIEFPTAPIASVTGVFLTLDDDTEEEVTPTVYRVSTTSGRVALRRGMSWPRYASELAEVDAWRVRFIAGHAAADVWTGADVDADPKRAAIRQAIAVQVAEWYENRGDDPDVGTGSTASAGAQLVLGEQAKAIIRTASLRRYVL